LAGGIRGWKVGFSDFLNCHSIFWLACGYFASLKEQLESTQSRNSLVTTLSQTTFQVARDKKSSINRQADKQKMQQDAMLHHTRGSCGERA
jgi:hypothetical protein